MKISHEEIEKAALDARVNLNAEEKEQVSKHAQAFMELLEVVSWADLEELPATCYGHREPGRMREDKTELSLPLEKALQNAADADQYCFHVPRIVED